VRILIVGAGIAGPTLAYWLRQYGFTPTLIEQAPAPRIGGYVIDFWGIGYDVAESMGIRPLLERDAYRIDEVRLVDSTGKRIAGFDAEVFRAVAGSHFLSLPRGDLARRLYESVDGCIETMFDQTITGIDQDSRGVTVAFEHGKPRQFELVIGADGLHSQVRRVAFDEAMQCERFLGYYTAAFSATDYPHRDERAYVCYTIPGAQVARYALRDDRSAFFFIFAQPEPLGRAHDLLEQKHLLQERFAGRGWECDEILHALDGSNDLYFDAVAQTRLSRWCAGRVALVGDAAYAPSLLAGQGAALAMAGAYVLANALHRAAGDHEIAFAEYQKRFKPFVDAKRRAAAGFGWWFAPRTRLGLCLRNLTTRVMDLPFVAHRIAARTLGDRFTLPG
jgi:2-polyprenyl-6-methoxyphenol hydroxylase-like FAD-dependent oxidoreductase